MEQYPDPWCAEKQRSAQLHIAVRLEGGAGGIPRGGGVGGTYGDLAGSATGLAVVIGAVLHVTADALDMIATLLVVHFNYHP